MPKRDRWSSDDEDGTENDDDGRDHKSTTNVHPNNDRGGHSSTESTVRRRGGRDEVRISPTTTATTNGSHETTVAPAPPIPIPDPSPPPPSPPHFRMHNPLLDGCRSVYDSYQRISHLDEGTYGVVWKARDNATREIVALKQVKFDVDPEMTKEGFPISALREIGILLALNHENIVTVREMVVGDNPREQVYMVMECMAMDLQAAMTMAGSGGDGTVSGSRANIAPFAQSEVKCMMHNVLSGLSHVHSRWYVHRDVKTSNVLVHRSGRLALCDFGLARKYEVPYRHMTQMVVTLWYRSPELLFGESRYGPEIDMWR
jgi:cell division cycle 2-like protein